MQPAPSKRPPGESAASSAHVLMRKGKRAAATYVLSECGQTPTPKNLHELLDLILRPAKKIDDWETIDWCKWLMAGGRTPDEFSAIVHGYDNATTCGLVWTANFVAYRCRTCSISPCMSLCSECFQHGNHDGHDFNMFRSQAGGACDCGDTSVMKETGFCQRHGPKAQVNKATAPGDLLCVAEAMMPRIILRLIQHLRQHSHARTPEQITTAVKDADTYLTMLHDFSAMGAAMRRVMTGALTNPQVYKNLTDYEAGEPRGVGKEIAEYMKESKKIYEEALRSLPNPEPPHEYKDCPSLQEHLVHLTFLEELVFWTVKFEFPQKTVCLLLNMLPDADYKENLTRAFVLHYSRISMMLENTVDPDGLSNRVVHVSVQLFSNEGLAMRMAEKLHLLHVMVISLKYMMSKILIQNTLHDPDKNFHYVVDCGHNVMKDHCYWPLVSDLNNVLSHKGVALKFMSEDALLDMWFAFLSMFQGMNVNKRETTQHIEFEPNTYYAAFSAELEASAYPMWSMVSHLNDPELLPYSKRVLKNCLAAIQEWLDAINFTANSAVDSSKVSFHLPLHRYFSVFMCQAIKQQKMSLSEILPPPETLHLMMIHPLRVQVAFYEILAGKWVRNGLQIKGQAMTYIQCNFCNSMVDADIYLLQVCATQLPPATFLRSVLDNFQVRDWLSLSPYNANNIFVAKHNDQMLESFLSFLSIVTCVRTNLGLSDAALIQLEMVTLLCMGDKTHSQLLELMPERCGNNQGKDFESELAEVAHYRQPNLEASGNMQQGMYAPRPHVWENMYDPIHIMLRAVHRRDFQSSMDNFTEYARQTSQIKTGSTPWPPYRKPAPVSESYEDPRKLLNCKTLHAAIFAILLRALKAPNVPEQSLSLAVFLLEMALDVTQPQTTSNEICQTFTTERKQIFDLDFANWFETDWLSANLRTQIDVVSLPDDEPQALPPESQVVDMITFEEDQQLAVVPARVPYELSFPSEFPSLVAGNELVPVSAATTFYPPALTAAQATFSSPPLRALEGSQQRVDTPLQLGMQVHSNADFSSSSDEDGEKDEQKKLVQGEGGVKYRAVYVGESIISLLLKLHSSLSGVADSFDPSDCEAPAPATQPGASPSGAPHPASSSRIGDGPFFIGKLLHKIGQLDPLCLESIVQTRQRIWPRAHSDEELDAKEARERELRRRRAKERQQKLMAEFQNRQRQFMEKAKETEGSEMDWAEEQNTVISKIEYECVICSQSSPSTNENPMGLVVLLQTSSIVGHRRHSAEPHTLPITEEQRLLLQQAQKETLAADFVRRGELLHSEFDNTPWQLALNLGCESGVHVQTCGHHIHLECLMPYLNSLRGQQRQQSLAVDRGEYACPLCRQLANSVLPLSPELGDCLSLVRSRTTCMASIGSEIWALLSENPPSGRPPAMPLQEAMGRAMEDMAKIVEAPLRFYHQFRSPPTPECLGIFVSSILRTNLEIDVIQRGGTLCSQPDDAAASSSSSSSTMPKRSSLGPLVHVLGMHAKTLATWPEWKTWQQLAGMVARQPEQAVARPMAKEVPLLLKDPSALLTQFVLLLPMRLEQSHFTCVVQCLYNLLYFECLLQVLCDLSEEWRARVRSSAERDLRTLEGCLALLAAALEPGRLLAVAAAPGRTFERAEAESWVQTRCLPFLRLAALLRHHLYGEALPEIAAEQHEFVRLVYYLELVTDGMEWSKFNAAVALGWAHDDALPAAATLEALPPTELVRRWCDELLQLANESEMTSISLVQQHQRWYQPRLLQLPQSYDKIFQFYHRRQCVKCHSVPRETSVCLLCGTIVCLKENCCKQQDVCEAVQHSITCGAGTAMFLVVTSSYIIVIRGKRACLWGSVYLDSFGEEDRDLKRGKPLYLSAGRYQLLEQQWLLHRFDHTNKKWVWHRDAL